MFKTIINALKLPEVRKRLYFTLFIFLLIRLGHYVIIPYIDRKVVADMVSGSGFLGLLDLFSGGGYRNFSIFTLGVLPYINSSIILQLLGVVIPSLEAMQKEGGEEGRRKIAQITNWLTLGLGTLQAFMFTNYVFKDALKVDSPLSKMVIIITMVAGTYLLIWLGELITERGMGNGVSLIIFAGIISRLPTSFFEAVQMVKGGTMSLLNIAVILLVMAVILALIVYVYQAERRIAVQYSRRIVGRKTVGGQSTFIPLRLVQAGVLPIIFASSVLTFPGVVAQFLQGTAFATFVEKYLSSQTSPWFNILFFLLIVFFTYFYTEITYNPKDISDNLQKNGGFIPGVRPGDSTSDFFKNVLNRITLPASIFLGCLAVVPNILLGNSNLSIFFFGGTSILIVIGVAIEFIHQMEGFLVMRQYKGFLKG
ncbi:MAG: preprotein translocase subunit SecY [Caldisericia bacterium]|nr:preprotein translocase subunit SecY [Caldisericia bacterium]